MNQPASSSGTAKTLPRVLLLSVLTAVALILALSFITIFLRTPIVNSDPVRVELSELMQRLTGRDVVIDGDIIINEFPWITVVIGPGTLNNPDEFEGPPLLRWQRITLRVHYSSLYEPEPLIGPIIVDGLIAEPRIDRLGNNNFSDIGPLEDTGPPEAALYVPSIELRSAQIRYTDESKSDEALLSLENLQIKLSGLSRGSGAIEGSRFRLESIAIDGRLKSTASLGLTTEGLMSTTLKGVELNTPENMDASFRIEDASIGFGALQATLKNIMADPNNAEAVVLVKPAALDALMASAGILPPFKSTPNLFQLKEFSANLRYSEGALSADSMTLRVDDTRVSGGIRLEDPIRLSIDVDGINFERYATAMEGGGGYDPDAPLVFPGKLLQNLPLDGRIRFGRINARGANLVGVSLRLESGPTRASAPR
jgi:uncharacterized protein involved in outer membrane biogenesis